MKTMAYGLICLYAGELVARLHGWWFLVVGMLVGGCVGGIGVWIQRQRDYRRDELMWNSGADARQRTLELKELVRKTNELIKQQDHA